MIRLYESVSEENGIWILCARRPIYEEGDEYRPN